MKHVDSQRRASKYKLLGCLILMIFLMPSFPVGVDAVSSMGSRVCERVIARFGSDSSTYERINERMKKRLGFSCTSTGGKKRESVAPNSQNASSINYSPDAKQCTERKWKCGQWLECASGTQVRKCEMNYQIEKNCLSPEAVRPTESQACVVLRDPNYQTLSSAYDTYSNGFEELIEISKNYEPNTRLILLEILRGYSDNLSAYGRYISLALGRQLTEDEYFSACDLLKNMNLALDRFKNTMENASLNTPVPTIIIVPVEPQMSEEDHESLCIEETNRMAALGILNASNSLWRLVEMGCSTKEKFCAVFWYDHSHCP